MKFRILLFALFSGISVSAMSQEKALNIMTFNIRMNTPADGANAWPLRKDKAASQIVFHQVDLLGVQEALFDQMNDLQQLLPEYKYVGVGRDDGKTKGEFSAIFYKASRFEVLSSSTFWLSESPEVPGSKGWDAAITRIVTWAYFKDKKTGKRFYMFNTHFDHMGKMARANSAKLLLEKVNTIAGQTTAIITGDFNSEPTDEPIQIIKNSADALHLSDTEAISETPHYGPTGSFNGFQPAELKDVPIDYIFYKGKIKVFRHATLSQTWKGRFSSDHFPVFATVSIQ